MDNSLFNLNRIQFMEYSCFNINNLLSMEILGSSGTENCTGQRYESIEEAVKCVWGIDGRIVEHLAGYDTYNYLIQVKQEIESQEHSEKCESEKTEVKKMRKYIVKVYKNITQSLYKLLQIENAMLQHLHSQNKQARYPKSIKHKQYAKQRKVAKNVQADQIIIHESDREASFSSQIQLFGSLQSSQGQSGTNWEIKVGTSQQIKEKGLYREQYIKNIKLRQSNSYIDASVRVLEYIQGTLLTQIITNHLLIHKQQIQQNDPYYRLILEQIPKKIANYLTNPLQKITFSTSPNQWCSKLNFQQSLQRLKQRKWEWHFQSFIQNELFYTKRHRMIVENVTRPKWHGEIVEYFVNLYKTGLGELSGDKLRKCIIHHDTHQWNILINKHSQVDNVSFIDFGNLKYTYLIEDIAIYTLYILYNTPYIPHINYIMPSIIQSYSEALPLTLQELKLFYLSVPLRMCMSLCNSQYAMVLKPEDEYVKIIQKKGWTLLQAFKQLYHEEQEMNEKEGQPKQSIFKTKLFQRIKEKTTIKEDIQIKNEKQNQKKSEQRETATESQLGDELVEAKIDVSIKI